MAAEGAFVWGRNGRKLSPEEMAKQREIADAMMRKGMDYSPVGHWAQGAARVAEGVLGALDVRELDNEAKANKDWNAGKFGEIANLLSGGAVAPSAGTAAPGGANIPMTSAAGEVSATSPVTGDTYAPFMDTIKQGGVNNPYALAAIAATGRAESGWSAANANRTWSDPSESGQPGTAGGIMSWRGPRYQALAATGDLSPQGQAKFFLNEDPALIQKLNGAKSLEEAQQLMNNAWAFAGYNRPGGESARRLGFAKGYLSGFQGGNTEVASLDPSAGMISPPVSGYRDPLVSAPNNQATIAPPLPAPQMVSAPPSVAKPQQVAQATAPGGQPIPPAIMEVLSDPRADARTRGIAEILLKQNMARQQAAEEQRLKQSDPAYQLGLEKNRLEVENLRNPRVTPGDKLARERFDWEKENGGRTSDIKEYEYARERGYEGSFVDFQLAQKKAGAGSTSVTVGEGDKFYENLDKKNAETFAAMSDSGMQARAKLGQIDRLESLMANAPQGAVGALKQAAGEWGIATEGLSDIQAASALLEKMVPEQRAPGSGPMSDADIKMFRASLPRVLNQPGGNQLIFQTMRGIAQYETQMGEIADQVADRIISPADGRKMIRELKNPLADFKIPEGPTPNEGWKEISPGVRIRKVD
ncbi:hypothetical protein [Agrobacterium tumefaciens]|uniref:hypothetical protein n=1 Tax=Agrobacterium tumefaciens TaxID=358 RepID=UPI0015724632|nr:hypothetical protein [Agrobacterium tumefaciens]NTB01070.1 hypothetical protein [Agrobacterium tumefaciens]